MAADLITTETTSGRVRGRRRVDGGLAFLGVPYGQETSGANRFRPPKPARAWAGVRDALAFGPNACQGDAGLPAEDAASTKGLGLPDSEDCLVLNVWTPACDGGRRPVMVWLHGGAFRVGSGSHPVTDGARLSARGDVVVVSVNHRLNVFGHLFLDDVPGIGVADTANVGLRDIVLALAWVRDNVAAFGGDPTNVTIFGQSGGGRKVCCLTAMPAAAGLFHKAIVQSGPHPRGIPRDRAARFADGFLRHLGVTEDALGALQRMGPARLLDAVMAYCRTVRDPAIAPTPGGAPWMITPVVDGTILPADPWGTGAPEVSRHVPLLIGTTKDEAAIHLARRPDAGKMSELELRERCRAVLGDRAEAVIAAHRTSRPNETPWELMVAIASEDRRIMSIDIAEKKAGQGGADAFMYFFTWESDAGLYRSAHTMDLPFVFRTFDRTPITGSRGDRAALADAMSDAWIAFTRSGRPGHAGIPPWPSYALPERATMLFDAPARLQEDPWRAEREAWDREAASMPWEEASFVATLNPAPTAQRG
jgi:para-nitrobenzyl esterase